MRDGFARRLVAFILLGLCAISLRLTWGATGDFPISLGTTTLTQQNDCAPVTRIRGRDVQQSEPFRITGDTLRVLETFEGTEGNSRSSSSWARASSPSPTSLKKALPRAARPPPTRTLPALPTAPARTPSARSRRTANIPTKSRTAASRQASRATCYRPAVPPLALPIMPSDGCPKEYPTLRDGASVTGRGCGAGEHERCTSRSWAGCGPGGWRGTGS